MKHTAFMITFAPVAVSIFCSILFLTNNVFQILPVWVLWDALMISTVIAFFIVGSILLIGFAQWFVQQMNKPAV